MAALVCLDGFVETYRGLPAFYYSMSGSWYYYPLCSPKKDAHWLFNWIINPATATILKLVTGCGYKKEDQQLLDTLATLPTRPCPEDL